MRELEKAILLIAVYLLGMFPTGCGSGQSSPPPISVSISPLSVQSLDQAQSVTLTASVVNDATNKGVTWSVSGTGCSGSTCGTISGVTAGSATYTAPATVNSDLSVKVTAISVADSTKSATAPIVVVAPPSITTTLLPNATGGAEYSATLQESGGVAPFSWSVTSGNLPTGLSMDGSGNITGTPMAGGKANFTVQVTDSGGQPLTASASFSVTVNVIPLSIGTTSLPDGIVDTTYNQLVQVSGGIPPYTWSVASGSPPSWATINSAKGNISGIPGSTGTSDFVLRVTDSETPALNATQALLIKVVSSNSVNNAELYGQYAFLFHGFDDATGSQMAVVGSFTADGKGIITSGIQDENGPNGISLNLPFTGTYDVGADNRGAITILTESGATTYALALNSIKSGVAQQARFVEFDDTTGTSGRRGSGILRLQDHSAFTLSKISGPYAFGFSGQDKEGNREAIAGAFNADGSGMIVSGITDENIAGTATNLNLSGSYKAPTARNGRASITLNTSGAQTLQLSAYLVSGSEMLVMSTDVYLADGLISGRILSQTSAAFDNKSLNTPAVYYELGVNSSAPATRSVAEVGLLTADGNGALAVTYDKSSFNSIAQNLTNSGTYSVATQGRTTINGWHGQGSMDPLQILYLVGADQGFILDTSPAVGFGYVEAQTAVPTEGFSNASFSGTLSATTNTPAIGANVNATGTAMADGAGNLSEKTSLSMVTGLLVDQTTSGTYAISGNGRGLVTSLIINSASMGSSAFGLLVAIWLLIACRKNQKKTSRSSLALFCFAAFFAQTPAGCPTKLNQLAFYMISPTKAILIPEQSLNGAPEITIVER
jgi:Putative Ig domain